MLISNSNGAHTSHGHASHATVFGFVQVAHREFGQAWGAHVFSDGATEVFFDAKRDLRYEDMIPITCKCFLAILNAIMFNNLLVVFPFLIAYTVHFGGNGTITWGA